MKRAVPRVSQSPMAGCTDLAYRRIARRFGCDLAFCEMVKDRPVVEGSARTFEMLRTAEWDHPLGMQLLGRDPALMADAARRLEALGADLIDINLGCPVNKVTSDGCGSALLKEPAQVGRILDSVVPAVRLPVTIKMRTGFDDGDDDRFLEIARIAGESGVTAIAVHGRTRKQMYSGFSNHDAIRRVKEVARVPVIGNGDIRSGPDAKRMMDTTGCDGVMVARGALGNPWIYREIVAYLDTGVEAPPPTVAERAAVLRDHFELLREYYGDRTACLQVRRVLVWFIKAVSGGAELRDRGNRVTTVEDFHAIVSDFARALDEKARAEPAPAVPGSP